MKKKLILALAAVLTLSVGIIGCGGEEKKKDVSTLEKVKSEKVFTIGLNDDYPPFEYRDDKNEIVGFDIEFSKAIAKELGAELKIVTIPFAGIVEGLKAKKYDMIASGFSITEKRKKEVLFTDPYLYGGQYVVVKKGDDSVKGASDLKGKIVAAQTGTTGAEAANKIEGTKEVRLFDKAPEAFLDLKQGKVDAVVMDKPVCDYYMAKDAESFTKIDVNIQEEPIAFAFRMEDKDLQEEVNKAFAKLKENGTTSELSNKWFGYDITK